MSRMRLHFALMFTMASAVSLMVGGCPNVDDSAVNGDSQAGPPVRSPAEAALSNQRPVAEAGEDVAVVAGEIVSLSGTASSDADGDRLSFVWRQVSGEPQVELKSPFASISTFVAPAVAAETVLVFRLTVVDGFAAADDEVVVTVLP